MLNGLAFPHCPFGCLQRVDFNGGSYDLSLGMGCKVANSKFPFGGWGGECLANFLGIHLNYPLAALAFVDDRIEYSGRINLIVCYSHIMVSLKK